MTAFLGGWLTATYAPGRQNLSNGMRKKIFLSQKLAYVDTIYSGMYRIYGTVAVTGSPDIPVYRQLALYHEKTKRLARAGWSDDVTGAYAFENISAGPWTVVGWDHTLEYNAVVASNRVGEPM